MKIKSLSIKNFRIHKDVFVEFDDKLTLIGGPNESGKSTIAEALHKVLFLKSKGNTELHREMKSLIHNGDPEVEINFIVQDTLYVLHKIFSANGRTRLSSPGTAPLIDDAAEDMLARLLGTTTGLSQSAYRNKWNNLWVWQGSASNDPLSFASDNRNDLIIGMQSKGAAILLQSNVDMAVSTLINNKFDSIFHKNGDSYKTKTPPSDAQLLLIEKKKLYEDSKAKLNELYNAATSLQESINDFVNNEQDLNNLNLDLNNLYEITEKIKSLRQNEESILKKRNDASIALQNLTKENEKINEKVKENESSFEVRKLLDGEIAEMTRYINDQQNEIKRLNVQLAEISDNKTLIIKKKDFYQNIKSQSILDAEIKRFENSETILKTKLNELKDLKIELEALPEIEQAQISDLEELNKEISNIDAAMNAIATSVEIIKGNDKIKVNDALSNEKSFTFTNDTIFEVGSDFKMKVIPGGGTSLSDYKTKYKDKRNELQILLQELKVNNLAEANKINIQRVQIQEKINQINEQTLTAELQNVSFDIDKKKTEFKRAQNTIEQIKQELNLTINNYELDLDQELSQLNSTIKSDAIDEMGLRAQVESLKEIIKNNSEKLENKEAQRNELDSVFNKNETFISYLTEIYGEKTIRENKLQKLKSELDALEQELKNIQNEIASYNPEKINSDLSRFERAKENMNNRSQDLIIKKTRYETILSIDGNTDQREVFDLYEKQYKSAQQEYEVRRKEAEALKMLNTLFVAEQQNLSNEFTRPFAEKVTAYLSHVFNTGVSVKVNDVNGSFNSLDISRKEVVEESALNFENLSGGAKEQVSAAFRLAIAEVLATNYEGCLPIIFDDAFAFSDPNRIRNIQSMLDYAANKGGLQVIVLSCNPSDYKFLGAKEIVLN